MAKSSFGIECARLAGVPDQILSNARMRSTAMEALVDKRRCLNKCVINVFFPRFSTAMRWIITIHLQRSEDSKGCPRTVERRSNRGDGEKIGRFTSYLRLEDSIEYLTGFMLGISSKKMESESGANSTIDRPSSSCSYNFATIMLPVWFYISFHLWRPGDIAESYLRLYRYRWPACNIHQFAS